MATPPTPQVGALPSGTVSTADLLTALKNVVTALNNASQTYLAVNGLSNYPNISTSLAQYVLVKGSAGRIASVSVLVAGSASGAIYDAITAGDVSKPLYIIPMVIGVYVVNLPANYGIVVAPGTAQVLTVSYS
jgi:hypothetical protein